MMAGASAIALPMAKQPALWSSPVRLLNVARVSLYAFPLRRRGVAKIVQAMFLCQACKLVDVA